MKFETLTDARNYAKKETRQTGQKHAAVKTTYWNMKDWKHIPCYTVVLIRK